MCSSPLIVGARCAVLGCALWVSTALAEPVPLQPVQHLEPTEEEVFPEPDLPVPVSFGADVAVDAHRALISMPVADDGAGRVAVFRRDRAGQWQRTGSLKFSTPPNGVSQVELRGTVAVVASSTTLYVFRLGANGTWQQGQTLTVDAGESIVDVDYDGETAVAGVTSSQSAGAAYIFRINREAAIRQQKIVSPSGLANDRFASAVAVSGPTLVVGAPGFNNSQGAAHVFRRARNWTHAQTLVAADGEAGDGFGAAVAVHGWKIAVGAPAADPEYGGEFEQLIRQGAAFVFLPRGTQWVQSQKLRPSDDGVETAVTFGVNIDIDAHRIAIGSPGINGLVYEGSVFIYQRTGRSFTAVQEARSSIVAGYAFSLTCDTLLVGLVEPAFYTGRAEVYDLRR